MEPLSINSLVMPAEFPRDDFEGIQLKLDRYREQHSHGLFVGAWSAISYRYHGLTEYDRSFTASIVEHGPGPAQPIRAYQERDLFGFFSSGVSIFDAYCFGMFAVGAILDPTKFPLASENNEQAVRWERLRVAYYKCFQNDPFAAALDEIWNAPSFEDLRLIRNVLTHRAAPPRHHRLHVGSDEKSGATLGRVNIELDRDTTSTRRLQLSGLLTTAMQAARAFVETHC